MNSMKVIKIRRERKLIKRIKKSKMTKTDTNYAIKSSISFISKTMATVKK